jgi:hypothetical protein
MLPKSSPPSDRSWSSNLNGVAVLLLALLASVRALGRCKASITGTSVKEAKLACCGIGSLLVCKGSGLYDCAFFPPSENVLSFAARKKFFGDEVLTGSGLGACFVFLFEFEASIPSTEEFEGNVEVLCRLEDEVSYGPPLEEEC